MLRTMLFGLALASAGASASAADVNESTVIRPKALLRTAPVRGDADDPAIWVHPTNPEKSLVLGTDKKHGLMVYNMDGSLRQAIAEETRPNNVDVLYDFRLGGKRVDLAVAGCRQKKSFGVKVWVIDPSTGTLHDVTDGGTLRVFGGDEPYGACTYRSARTGNCYFFVTGKNGEVEQFRLEDANGMVKGSRVRSFAVGSTAEGCVADGDLGFVYIAEEKVGIWKFGAEPESSSHGTLVAKVGEHGLDDDVEGLTLYCATGARGYLIASSQGNNTCKVYDRGEGNRYLFTIETQVDGIDGAQKTDGIAVTSCPTSRQLPHGVFVAHDGGKGKTDRGGDFHFYPWEAIAGDRWIVDTRWSPRAQIER